MKAFPPTIRRANIPSVVPAVVTSDVAAINANPAAPGQYPADGLDGAQLIVAGNVVAPTLPGEAST